MSQRLQAPRCVSAAAADRRRRPRSGAAGAPGLCSAHAQHRNSAQRQPKDPQQFRDWEEIRSSLHEESTQSGFVSGVINFLSGSAFGKSDSQGGWQNAAGQLYRRMLHSRWADGLQSGVEQRPGYAAHDASSSADAQRQQGPAASDASAGTAGLREVTVILNCTHSTASTMARRFPALLDMTSAELQSRLMQMKEELPNCDVAELVQQYPRDFLEPPQDAMITRLAAVNALLRSELVGANVDAMISEDPQLLTQDPASISKGLEELHNLWEVDAKALADSDPWKLALAVRSLSPTGPPRRF